MPDETPGTGQSDHSAIQSLENNPPIVDDAPIVDDDVDFYDDEPGARGGAAISPPAESAQSDPGSAGVEQPPSPWREPAHAAPAAEPAHEAVAEPAPRPAPEAEPAAVQPAAEPVPEPAAVQPAPEPAAVQPAAEPVPEAARPAAIEPDAVPAEPAAPDAGGHADTANLPAAQQSLPVPDEEMVAHRTRRVPTFDDLADQRTDFIGGIHLPASIESDLEDRKRPAWRPPLLVWVITGVFISLMTMCTFLYPAFTGYDEPFHVDMTYSYYNGNGFYAPGDRLLSIGVQTAIGTVHPPPTTPFSQQTEPARGARTSFDAAGGDRAGTYKIPNQMVQHPPLYYAIGAGIMHLVPGSHNLPYDRWVAILRYMSILMLAPLPILGWASVKALIGDGPAAVTAAALPLTLPNLARIGGNVNNDSLLITLTAAVILVLCKVMAGDLRKRTGLLAGLLTGLACLTKGTALVLPVVVLLAYAVAWARHRRRPWAPFGMAALVTAVVGGWWWVRNLILFGAVQPEGFGGKGSYGYDTFYMTAKHPPSGTYNVHEFIPAYLVRVLWRTWGGIGYPENPFFARTATWIWFGIVAAGAIFAVAFGLRGRFGRASAFVFVLPTIFLLGPPMYNALHHYLYNGVLPGAQGRYLYPSVTAVGLLVGVGYTRLVGRKLAAWVPLVIIIGAMGTQVDAWRQLVKVWWVPTTSHGKADEFKDAFRAILRWSPWAHPVATASFIAVVAFVLLLLAAAVGYGVAHRAGDDEPVITDAGTTREQLPASAFVG